MSISALDADVIVVGAGLAGLAAAQHLQDAGISTIILEARDRVGGKTWSVDPIRDGNVVDVGAAWINDTNQSEVYDLAKSLGLQLVVQNTDGKVIQEDIDGSLSTFEYGTAPHVLSEADGVSEMLRIRQVFEDTCQTLDIVSPASHSNAMELDQMTLQQWVESHSTSRTALASASVWTRAMLGLEPSEVSALFFLNYCKSGGGLLQMRKDTQHGGQYLRFVEGTQSLSRGIAGRLKEPGTRLKLKSPATRIEQSARGDAEDNLVSATVDGESARTYTSRHMIVTLPTPLHKNIDFLPPLPPARQKLSQLTLQGYTNKVIILYQSPWWRKAGLCGLLQSFTGPITVTRDSSVDEVHQYSLTCFLVGAIGRQYSKLPRTERFNRIQEHVTRVFRPVCEKAGVKIEEPIGITEYEWVNDEYSGGCPVPCMPPGAMTELEGELRTSFGNVHFAGTETSLAWKGYMDGAIRSGNRVAKEVSEILEGLKAGERRN